MSIRKIVYNDCYGGFGISIEAREFIKDYCKKNNISLPWNEETEEWNLPEHNIPRHHPALIAAVETLGERASSCCARLAIAEIDGNKYWIREYDGDEEVMTPENIDWITIEEK